MAVWRTCHGYWTIFISWRSFIVFTLWFLSLFVCLSTFFPCVSISLPATVFLINLSSDYNFVMILSSLLGLSTEMLNKTDLAAYVKSYFLSRYTLYWLHWYLLVSGPWTATLEAPVQFQALPVHLALMSRLCIKSIRSKAGKECGSLLAKAAAPLTVIPAVITAMITAVIKKSPPWSFEGGQIACQSFIICYIICYIIFIEEWPTI